jgi:LysR family transcriptional regulator for bpeEF and oprC
MDKLRALEYFVAAAEEGSLSGAARRFEVTIPAVAKLVTSLEKRLGTSLFDRGSKGLTLTADGERYLESCRPLLEELADVDDSMGTAAVRPRGEVVVGAPAFALQNCLGPALPRFHTRYPDIDLDFRIVNQVGDLEGTAIDVFVLFGWHDTPDMVQKPVAQARYVVLGSPAYWAAHEPVNRPGDFTKHQCFPFRNPRGVLLDLWEFERGKEKESVKVRGWMASSHRNILIDAALGGEGVVRASDILTLPLMKQGRLVPVLQDWHGLHAPPVNIAFRPKHRRTPRIRAVVDFITDTFRRLVGEREAGRVAVAERPVWYERRYGRASSSVR